MKEIVPIFINGYLDRTEPELDDYYEHRELINHAVYMISDGEKYNLENAESIASIKIPKEFADPAWEGMGIVGVFDYVLRMKATELRKRKENELSICLLKKAYEIMKVSPINWQKKDYMRLVSWLCEDARFDEADLVSDEINYLFRNGPRSILAIRMKRIKDYAEHGYDLIISDNLSGYCSECAKYRLRVYSISGNDKRFPKLPPPWECTCSGLSFHPFFESTDSKRFPNNDYIGYSNRPYIDDRTPKDIELYQNYLERKFYEDLSERDKINHSIIKHLLPDIAPKSMGAFARMRNDNTKKYKELVLKAAEIDVDISLTEEERIMLDSYLVHKKEFGY